ncbi:MAG: glycosyltransferase, partial [Muribaculaceae bacterium]
DTGVYNAINKGITLAKGDVIGLLHADDLFSCDSILERVARGLTDKWVDLVYGDVVFVDSKDTSKVVRKYSARRFTPDKLRYGYAPPHPSLYCKKELFERYGLYKENYITAADFEMFVRLFRHSSVLSKYLPIEMVIMRMDGISSQWKHRLTTNVFEKRRALRENNVRISLFSLLRKYYYLLNP